MMIIRKACGEDEGWMGGGVSLLDSFGQLQCVVSAKAGQKMRVQLLVGLRNSQKVLLMMFFATSRTLSLTY